MINCNPETVSTDFDVADKLYFEPVFWEHIYDIIQHEKPEGVIVQLGGQTALKLAEKLDRYGIKIIGTTFKSLDLAEDRGSFSELLKKNNIPYPEFGVAETAEQALELSESLNFPILVRPSYVLGGQGMKIVINKEDLEKHVVDLLQKIPNNKLLLDHYLDGAIEAEDDAFCDGENVQIIGIMEHIEPCGIHSGDSNATLPPFNLGDFVMQQIIDHTKKIALALKTIGLINIQFAIKDDTVYIIEANPRASRTVPFISKAYKQPYVNYATKIMLGKNKISDFKFESKLDGFAIKQPVFSFSKFPNVNKNLGPEMKSTGESILFIDDLKDDDFFSVDKFNNAELEILKKSEMIDNKCIEKGVKIKESLEMIKKARSIHKDLDTVIIMHSFDTFSIDTNWVHHIKNVNKLEQRSLLNNLLKKLKIFRPKLKYAFKKLDFSNLFKISLKGLFSSLKISLSAPYLLHSSNFSTDDATAITSHPSALQISIVAIPMPPDAPKIITLSFFLHFNLSNIV